MGKSEASSIVSEKTGKEGMGEWEKNVKSIGHREVHLLTVGDYKKGNEPTSQFCSGLLLPFGVT